MASPEIGDAFGQMLIDCLEDGGFESGVFEIVERSDGFIEAGLAGRYFGPFENWPERDKWLISQVHGRTLDIGSGAGRHAVELQTRGIEVVSLDNSALALEVCRRQGVRQTVVASIDAYRPDSTFDSFLMLGNNIGLLESPAHAVELLERLATFAQPQAALFGTFLDASDTEDPIHLAYHEGNRVQGRQPGQMTLRHRYGRIATPWFEYYMPSLAELEEMIAPTGWRLREHEAEGPTHAVILQLES